MASAAARAHPSSDAPATPAPTPAGARVESPLAPVTVSTEGTSSSQRNSLRSLPPGASYAPSACPVDVEQTIPHHPGTESLAPSPSAAAGDRRVALLATMAEDAPASSAPTTDSTVPLVGFESIPLPTPPSRMSLSLDPTSMDHHVEGSSAMNDSLARSDSPFQGDTSLPLPLTLPAPPPAHTTTSLPLPTPPAPTTTFNSASALPALPLPSPPLGVPTAGMSSVSPPPFHRPSSQQMLVSSQGTSSQSTRTAPVPTRSLSSDKYFSGSGMGMEGPYPSMTTAKTSKGKSRAEEDDNLRASTYGYPGNGEIGGVLDNLANVVEGQRDSMVGVGRNSLLRANASGVTGDMMGPVADVRRVSRASLLQGPSDANGNPSSSVVPLPPHLVPQPEICVECMMRDRDMIDIDVTTPGVWTRGSDVDLEEWEEAGSSVPCGDGGSDESGRGRSRDSHARSSVHGGIRRAKGLSLTVSNLKVWTGMNIPAATHRWRTLQVFLAAQLELIVLEPGDQDCYARPSTSAIDIGGRNRASMLSGGQEYGEERDVRRPTPKGRSHTRGDDARPSSIYTGPPANVRDYSSGDQPWLSSQARRFSSPALKGFPLKPVPHESHGPTSVSPTSTRPSFSYRSSTTDMRSPRNVSPGPNSLFEYSPDQRRTSLWSRFRQSASQSVLSLAPSGSMMDMHLGLSMDKHAMVNVPYGNLTSGSDPAVAHRWEPERDALRRSTMMEGATSEGDRKEKKKKGLKGFLKKIISGDSGRKSKVAPAMESGRTSSYYNQYDKDRQDDFDESPLAPPPRLSALANEPRYARRSSSSSSIDSFPHPQARHPRAASAPMPQGSSASTPATTPQFADNYSLSKRNGGDRGSIITTGSGRSGRFVEVGITNGRAGGSPDKGPPSLADSCEPEVLEQWTDVGPARRGSAALSGSVRKEKSLPSLPPPESGSTYRGMGYSSSARNSPTNRQTFYSSQDTQSAYSIRSPSLVPSLSRGASPSPANLDSWDTLREEDDDLGGGRKSKARKSIFSMVLVGFGSGKKQTGSVRSGNEGAGVSEGWRREGSLVS